MAIERMQVTNHERWGNLVKTWSTGKNYLDDDNEYPIPTTIDEFKEQLAKAQVFMTVPDRFTKVNFVEQHLDTIVVRLPPAHGDRGFRGEAQPAGRDLSASAVLQAPVQRDGSGDPGSRKVQGARRTYRRLHDQLLFLIGRRFAICGHTLNGKPCATQTVAQGFPSLLDADRMRLH